MRTEEEKIVKLVDDLTAAERRGDVKFLDGAMADEFVAIGPRGFMLNKNQWLGRHKSGDLKYDSLKVDELAYRSMKDDIIIVTGKETSSVKYQEKSAPVGELRTMEVFVKENDDQWKLAAKQMSPIMPATT